MRRAPVDSTSIASIGFDRRRSELEVEFRESGDVYRYFGVSAGEYADLMAAGSKGTYFNHVFKMRGHHYFVVKEGKRLPSNE